MPIHFDASAAGGAPMPRRTSRSIVGLGGLGSTPSLTATARDRGFPERAQLGQLGNIGLPTPAGVAPTHDAWRQGSDFFGSILGGVVKVMETPASIIDTASKALTGNSIFGGVAGALDKTPIGDLARGAESLLNVGQRAVGATGNAGFAALLKATAGQPDTAPLENAGALASYGSPLRGVALPTFLTDFLSGTQDIRTVGDLRRVATQRGFTPEDLAALSSGQRDVFSFGDRAMSTNPAVDMATRIAFDPTNLLFFGGPAAAKFGLKIVGAGLGLANDLEKAGVMTRAAEDSLRAAQAIAEGDYAKATYQGLGQWLAQTTRAAVKTYAKVAVASSVATVGADALSQSLADVVGPKTPLGGFLGSLHDLSSEIINDRPLSNSSIFALAAAMSFPFHDIAGGVTSRIAPARAGVSGGQGLGRPIVEDLGVGKTYADKVAYLDASLAGGAQQGVADIVNWTTFQIAARNVLAVAGFRDRFYSIPEAAGRVGDIANVIAREQKRLLDAHAITQDMIRQEFRAYYTDHQRYFDPGREGMGVRLPWNPVGALAQWNGYARTVGDLGNLLRSYGNVTYGLNERLYAERIPFMQAAVDGLAGGSKTLTSVQMREFLTQFPELAQRANQTNDGHFWLRNLARSAPDVTVRAVKDELARTAALLPKATDVWHETTMRDAAAPAAVPDRPAMLDAVARQDAGVGGPDYAAQMAQLDAEASGVITSYLDAARQRTALASTVDARGAISADQVARSQQLNAAIGEARGAAPGNGGAVLPAALPPAVADLHWSGDVVREFARGNISPESLLAIGDIQRQLEAQGSRYTVKVAPQLAVDFPQTMPYDPRLLQYNALATWFYDSGLSAPMRLLGWFTHPVRNAQLAQDARQAVYDELVGKYGLSATKVDQFLTRLRTDAEKHTISPFGVKIRLFPNPTALLPDTINDIARDVFGRKADAVFGAGERFDRILDRSANRFMRSVHDRVYVEPTGRLARAIDAMGDTYNLYQRSPLGSTQRLVTKTFYYAFRFMMDPRWHTMNFLEADLLGAFRYGLAATRAEGANVVRWSPQALQHETGHAPTEAAWRDNSLPPAEGETGQMFTRENSGYVSRAFDAERPSTVTKALNELPANSTIVGDLVTLFGPNRGGWAAGLDKMLYDFDTKGVKQALEDTATALHMSKELGDPNFQQFLLRLRELNQASYDSIVNAFAGNMNRTNVERILNSYWLYWPLSYQLKAGKWMFDIMTKKGMFGPNLSGAYWWNHVVTQHEDRLANDPEYRSLMEDHPTLWFTAQMLFPITPSDLGVSLSRVPRYAGGWIGLWPQYQQASDPFSMLSAVLKLGPTYTADLVGRIAKEFAPQP